MEKSIFETIQRCARKQLFQDFECNATYISPQIGSESSFGTVHRITCGKNPKYILKIVPINSSKTAYPLTDEDIQREVTMQKRFYDLGMAPQIVEAFSCENTAYIIMQAMDIDVYTFIKRMYKYNIPQDLKHTIMEFLFSKAISLVDACHMKGLVHGDPHLQNIMMDAPSYIFTFFQMLHDKHTLTKQEARAHLKSIAAKHATGEAFTPKENVYLQILIMSNGEDMMDDLKPRLSSFVEDLLMYFGEDQAENEYEDLMSTLLSGENLVAFLKPETMKFIDFGQSDLLQNQPNLISTDWSKLGGGKYKQELLSFAPEAKTILDTLSMVGLHE